MSTPSSSPEAGRPDVDLSHVAQDLGKLPVRRKGPRRATSPAGAPAVSTKATAAVHLVGADGVLLPSPSTVPIEETPPSQPDADDANDADDATAADTGGGPTEDTKSTVTDSPALESAVELDTASATDSLNTATASALSGDAVEVKEPSAHREDISSGTPQTTITSVDEAAVAGGAAILAGASSDTETKNSTVVDPAPQSRRERRLAEQKSSVSSDHAEPLSAIAPAVDVSPRATSVEILHDDSATDESTSQQRLSKKRGPLTSFIRGLMAFLLIAILVAALGTALVGTDESLAGPVDTEVNRQAAWERTTALSTDALLLSEGASTPEMAEALRSTAQDLAAQAAALDDGLPEPTAIATADTTSMPAAPTLPSLLSGLTSSGDELMQNAVTAERAMGRVFAAVGTSQILQGQRLSTLAGSTPPLSKLLPASTEFAEPQGPPCSSTLEPRSGVTVDSALRAAAHGEQKAIYAYQVAATRLKNPQFVDASELLLGHQKKLDLLNAELSVRCLEESSAVAGFELDPSFTTTPISALAELESELSAIYANLAALSTPAPESSSQPAVSAKPTDSIPSNLTTAAPTTTAPTTTADVSAIQPANNGLLRQMSVAWLLDSSAAQLYWGGTVAPLAGMTL